MTLLVKKKIHPILIALVFLLTWVWSLPVHSSTLREKNWSGVVTYVIDGDTVKVRPPNGGKPISIRIEGIDAPEICQQGGTLSRNVLKRKALGRQVQIRGKLNDKYGRLLAKIMLNGEDLGQWMVIEGQAWSYRYKKNPGPYIQEQRRAKVARLGLFSLNQSSTPIEPKNFRKRRGYCRF